MSGHRVLMVSGSDCHGTAISVKADQMGLTAQQCADIVLTEAGFGSDLGAEKFFDIKARYGNLDIAGAVIVATIRSLSFR